MHRENFRASAPPKKNAPPNSSPNAIEERWLDLAGGRMRYLAMVARLNVCFLFSVSMGNSFLVEWFSLNK